MLNILEHVYANAEGYAILLILIVVPLGLYASYKVLQRYNEII